MKNEQKELALKLRIEEHLSINQIAKLTRLAKSTVSLVVRDYPLTPERVRELNIGKQLNGAKVNKDQAEERRKQAQLKGLELSNTNPDFKNLCFLYWGEGTKSLNNYSFTIANTDHAMVKYIMKVLTDIGFSDNVKLKAYCYPNSDKTKIINFWKDYLGYNISTYDAKNAKSSKLKKTNKQENGVMHITVHSIELLNMVMGVIENIKQSV